MSAFTEVLFPRSAAVHWRRVAVGLWVLILLGGFIRGLVKPTRGDIGIIYTEGVEAARHWAAGEPAYPAEWRWEMFPYGPLLLVCFIPLSALPDALGSGVWRLTLGLSYLAALAWWSRAALPSPLSPQRRALLFLLVVPLTASTVLTGQVGGLVAAAVLLALAAAAQERWSWSALFAVVACLLKAYPVAVALLLAVTYPRRSAARLLLFGLLALAVPFLTQRPDYVLGQYAAWFNLLAHGDRSDWPLNIANRNLSLLFRVWLVPINPWLHLGVQLLSAAGVAGLCLAGQRAGWSHRRLLLNLLALAGCWMTLFGPVVESFTYILVGPTLAWLLLEAWQERRPLLYRALLVLSWGTFTAASAAVWVSRSTQLHNLGPHPLAGSLLLACVLWDLHGQFAARKAFALMAASW
jgi:hypothetical protein